MAKTLNLFVADRRLSNRCNELVAKIFLRDLAVKTYGKAVKDLQAQLDHENDHLAGVMGHDDAVKRLTAALADAQAKYKAVLASDEIKFVSNDIDKKLVKAWKNSQAGIAGRDARMAGLHDWLKDYGIEPVRDVLEELDYRLTHDVNTKAEKVAEGEFVRNGALAIKTLYREICQMHMDRGLIKDKFIPAELQEIYEQEKAKVAAKKAAKKSAKK